MEVPLVDKDYLLERTPGNGGWTYAPIPHWHQMVLFDFDTINTSFYFHPAERCLFILRHFGNGCISPSSIAGSSLKQVIFIH